MARFRLPQFIEDQPWLLGGSPFALLLSLASLGVAGMAAWIWFGGPGTAPHHTLTVAYSNPKKYPGEVFTTPPTTRQVTFQSSNGPTGQQVFQALDVAKLDKAPTTTAPQNAVTLQQLAAKGYTWTAESFISAARQGDVPILTLFLKGGFDTKLTNAFGNTALYAATEGNQPNAVKLLLAAGSDLAAANNRGLTPLHRAAEANLPGMAALLLAAGAAPDTPANNGWTPLFYAAQNNNADIAQALLATGAKATTADGYKTTPLHVAVRQGFLDMSKILLSAGAAVDATDANGTTPLHITILAGNYQLAKLLLDNGANATHPNGAGISPMSMALNKQNLAIANLLLAHGAQRPNALGK